MPRNRKSKTEDGPTEGMETYASNDEEGSRRKYHQTLNDVKDAIVRGNLNSLKTCCQSLYKIQCNEKEETLQKYYEHVDNPFFGTNFIIVTCRLNQYCILKYFLSSGEDVLLKLYEKIGRKFILPDVVDGYKHTAFYYAIRSNDVKMIEALSENWPGYDFSKHNEKLEELLSKPYEELQLKNVDVSPEMRMEVEKRLLDLRFFNKTPQQDFSQRISMQDIVERYDFLILKIDETVGVINDYLNREHLFNMMVLYRVKFIAQNIHVLKRLVKSTMDSIPWEELEFCAIVFVRTKSTNEELNMIFESVLTTRKLAMHLRNFVECLKTQRYHIINKTVPDVNIMPLIKREDAVRKIITNFPFFQELYNDYEICRDIHSLNTIRKYAGLSKSANPEEKNGRLIITRALQVLGECTKNTLMCPKMSITTGKRLLSNMGGDSRRIVADIRNSLSHSLSLVKRIDLEENEGNGKIFVKLQNDLERVNAVITDILSSNVLQVIKRQLEKIVDSGDMRELREISHTFRFVLMGRSFMPNEECGSLEKLVNDLIEKIPEPTITELSMISNIKSIVEKNKHNEVSIRDKHIKATSALQQLREIDRSFDNCNNNVKRHLIFQAKNILNTLSIQTLNHGMNMELNSREISAMLGNSVVKLVDAVSNRLSIEEYSDLYRVFSEIIHVVQFEIDKIDAIENLRNELKKHNAKFKIEDTTNQKQPKATNKTVCGTMIKKIIEELKNVMSSYRPCDSMFQNLLMYKDDEKILTAIEMLSMDILSILGSPMINRLSNNLFSIEMHSPTIVGKSFRNHLAHGNDIAEVLISNSKTAVILNAVMFTNHDIIKQTSLIGQLSWSDVIFLQEKDRVNADIVYCQQQLFQSLRDGDMERIKSSIRDGADLSAKTVDGMTALHFAALSWCDESLSYTLKQWKGSIDVRNSEGRNPFHLAASQGNIKNLKVLWARDHTLLETKDYDGNTALHLAASAGHGGAINYILAIKGNADANNYGGNTPLRLALFNNQIEASKILLKYYKPNSNPNGGFSPLHIAAESGSVELVQYLLLRGEDPKAVTDRSATAMHLAALNGHTEIVKALIEKGADVNAMSSNGGTPLLYAAETNREDIVELLVQSGANVNASGPYIFTPLFHAALNGNVKIAEILLKSNARVNLPFYPPELVPLHCAVVNNDNPDVIELLLRHKAEINAKNVQGLTPLHFATGNGHLASCTVLINHGADTSTVDRIGRSAIFYAAEQGHEAILKMMINARTNINTADLLGLTPLHLACLHGRTSVVKILVNNGAVVNGNLTYDSTPLQLAASNGFGEIVNVLLSKGTDVKQRDKLGLTALHHAASIGHTKIIASLAKAGANMNAICSTLGFTPLHMACYSGHTKASESLIQLGSLINMKDKNGCSPLAYAVQSKSEQSYGLVKMLIKKGATVDNGIVTRAIHSSSLNVVELLLNKSGKIKENSDFLAVACMRRHIGIIKAVLKSGLDADGKTKINGTTWVTPLLYAAEKGYEDEINILIEYGANPNQRGCDGETPLHKAAGAGHLNAAAALLAHKANILTEDPKRRTSLDLAIGNGHIDVVKMFIEHDKNVDVNRRAGNNYLPLLHIATQFGFIDLVKLLIKKGADVHQTNSSGSKAIHFAARDGYPDIIELFLSKKINIYDRGVGGNTLLHYAAHGTGDSLQVADFLINKKKMDVNKSNVSGQTPLFLAVQAFDVELVKFLIKHGAYYNPKDNMGITPADITSDFRVVSLFGSISKLFTAAKKGDLIGVNESIREGAVVDAKNNQNDSPLLCASWKGHENIINALLVNNANPNIVGKSGSTALHYAAKSGNYNIVKSLLGYGANYETNNDAGKVPIDYASSENIITLLNLIKDSFNKLKNRDITILTSLQKVRKDSEKVKALCNCTNNEGNTLISAAISADFPRVASLKTLFTDNTRLRRSEQLISAERYQEALHIILSEYNEGQQLFSRKSLMNSDTQSTMAAVLYKLQRYEEALNLFTDLYDTFKEMIGDDNKQTLHARMSIGLVLHREGRNEEAMEILKEVDKKQTTRLDPFDTQALETKSYLALVLDRLGKIDEALEINNYVLEKYKRLYGSNHAATLVVQNNKAMMLNNKGKHDEAIKLWNNVYEKRKKVLGPTHADTLRTKANIATAYLTQGKMNEAISINNEALSKQENKLSSTDRDILMSKMNKAMALCHNGQFESAIKLYREVSKNKEYAGPGFATFELLFSVISKCLNDFGMSPDLSEAESASNIGSSLFEMVQKMMGKNEKTGLESVLQQIMSELSKDDREIS